MIVNNWVTAPTRPPPKTTPTSAPPVPVQKQNRVNKNFVPREDGGPVTRSKKTSWADVAKLNCVWNRSMIYTQTILDQEISNQSLIWLKQKLLGI